MRQLFEKISIACMVIIGAVSMAMLLLEIGV